jgi:hypothetical protein
MTALLTIVAGGCDFFDPLVSSQPISGALDVGGEWSEITPPAPLKSSKVRQNVYVEMSGLKSWDEESQKVIVPEDGKTVTFADGRRGKIEAQLFDDRGTSYELAIYGLSGGVNLSRKRPPRSPDEKPSLEPDFPRDRTYTKLRVRSDVPFRSEKIEWVCTNPK